MTVSFFPFPLSEECGGIQEEGRHRDESHREHCLASKDHLALSFLQQLTLKRFPVLFWQTTARAWAVLRDCLWGFKLYWWLHLTPETLTCLTSGAFWIVGFLRFPCDSHVKPGFNLPVPSSVDHFVRTSLCHTIILSERKGDGGRRLWTAIVGK